MKKIIKEKTKKIDVELSDETFLKLAKEAHELDLTFNEYCNKLISEYIEQLIKESELKISKRKNVKQKSST